MTTTPDDAYASAINDANANEHAKDDANADANTDGNANE